jgi:2-polyprenyl-6-methoxyphenol hydroxylase-like FAD-dependent oxidoreductase
VRPSAAGRSPWESFTTVRNDRWSDGHLVLLGDSAHTAHFSIGSGTTMALADAAALARVLAGRRAADLPAALRAYEEERRPAVLALQDAAARSAGWFERVDEHAELSPLEFGFSLRMRRNAGGDGAGTPPSTLLRGLHRATQWRVGRGLRRAVARRRQAIQRRRAPAG